MLWVGRGVVLVIALIALLIAASPKSGSIMSLVENAWGIFGAAFGPTILLSLFWKRFNFPGAIAGILAGFISDIAWMYLLADIGLYELLPGFIISFVVAIVVTLATDKPSEEVEALFDYALSFDADKQD